MKQLMMILMCALCALSCRRVPLYDADGNVYVQIKVDLSVDIEVDPDIDIFSNPHYAEKLFGKMPEYVQLCFYSTETHELVKEDFVTVEGGAIDIPSGTYDLIVYSLGHETTSLSSNKMRGSLYAYSQDITTSKSYLLDKILATLKGNNVTTQEDINMAYGDDPIIAEPEHLYVGVKENIVIPDVKSNDKATTIVIPIDIKSIVETYCFEIRNIVGAKNIYSVDVFITGHVGRRYLWGDRYWNQPCTLFFNATTDAEKGHIYTVFNTFGKYPGADNEVILNLLIYDSDGGQYEFVYDVTDQFDDPDNTNHEIIIDEQIIIPESGSSGSGFDPSVSPWDEEDEKIQL